MKKILSLFVIALFAMSGWADNWLPGSWNNNFAVDNAVKFDFSEGTTGTLTLALAANTTYQFKVKDDTKWYGNSGTMSFYNHTDWGFGTDNGSDCQITTAEAGNYTFQIKWVNNNPEVSVIYPNCPWNIPYAGDGAAGGAYTAKYKVSTPESVNFVNIQHPGFATADGFYISFPDAAFGEVRANGQQLNYDVQGAGICLHVSNFTNQVTTVEVMNSDNTAVRWTIYVYYVDGTPLVIVPTTGISLNETTYELQQTKNFTLVATVTPADATDKNVTWSSNNENVATVVNGVVAAHETGTAVIKASCAGFEAICTVTVVEADEQILRKDDHMIRLYGVHYTGTNVYELTITSEEAMNGLGGSFWSTSHGNEQLNAIVGYIVDNNTLRFTTLSTVAPQIYTPLYVMMPGEVDFGVVTIDWAEKSSDLAEKAVISVSNAGYTSYYNSKKGYEMPIGMEGYIFNNETLNIEKKYEVGQFVPAGEALVLKAAQGNYNLYLGAASTQKEAKNALLGTDEITPLEADADYYFYALTLNAAKEPNSVGFYWMVEDGAAFTNGAHKAYLKLAKNSNAAPRYLFNGTEETTAVENVETVEAVKFIENGQVLIKKNGVVYNVMGQIVK